MAKEEIGFSQEMPVPDSSWGKQLHGKTFVFTKAREKGNSKVFLYKCTRIDGKDSSVATSFYSDRDLSMEEVEALPQFLNFIAGS